MSAPLLEGGQRPLGTEQIIPEGAHRPFCGGTVRSILEGVVLGEVLVAVAFLRLL